MRALSIIGLIVVLLNSQCVCTPYSYLSTNDIKLALVYGEEAVVGESFTITVSCVAITDLVIHEIVTLIWSVRDFKYKLLERAILVTNC